MKDLLEKEKEGIALEIDEKTFIDQALLILKSTEHSLNSCKKIIDEMASFSAKTFFYDLYAKALTKLKFVRSLLAR